MTCAFSLSALHSEKATVSQYMQRSEQPGHLDQNQSSTSEAQAPAGTQEQATKVMILFSILHTALTIAGQEWERSDPVNLL